MVAVCTLLMYQNSKPSLPACQPQSYHVCSFMMCCCPCRFMPVVHETDWHIEGYSCLIRFFFKSHFPLGWKVHASNIFLCQSTLSNLIFPCCPCVVRPWILLASVFAPAFLQLLPTTPHSTIPPFCLQKLVAWKPVVSHRLHVPSAHWMWKGTAAVATEPSPPTWGYPGRKWCKSSWGWWLPPQVSSLWLKFWISCLRLIQTREQRGSRTATSLCSAKLTPGFPKVLRCTGSKPRRTSFTSNAGATFVRFHGQPCTRSTGQPARSTGQPGNRATVGGGDRTVPRSGTVTVRLPGQRHTPIWW